MKKLLAAICLVIFAPAFSQSTLPPCQGSNISEWTNCVGTYSERSTFYSSEYLGEWKDGRKHGWGEIKWKVLKLGGFFRFSNWDDGGGYIGTFRGNFIDGEGSFRDIDGQFQSGDFKNWRFEGTKLEGLISNQPYEYDLMSGKLNKVAPVAITESGNKYELSPPFFALRQKMGAPLWEVRNSNEASCGENLSQFGLLKEYPLAAALAITADGKVECEPLPSSKVEDSALLVRVGLGAFVKKVDCRALGNRCYLIMAKARLREDAITEANRYLAEIEEQRQSMARTDHATAVTIGPIDGPRNDSKGTTESVMPLGKENNPSQAAAVQSLAAAEGGDALT